METINFPMRCPAIEGYWEMAQRDCPLVLSRNRLAMVTTGGDIHELTADGGRRWLGRVYPPDKGGMSTVMVRIGADDDAGYVEDLVRDALIAFEGNPAAALTRYSRYHHKCEICGRPLTNETSMRLGVGPECRGRRDALAAIRQESREWIAEQQGKAREAMRRWRAAQRC